MLIGTFSPLCRVFIPEYQTELINNPDKIYNCEKGWTMNVYRPTGNYPIKFGVPREEQNDCLLDWLAGTADKFYQSETDLYGIVRVPISTGDAGELFGLLELDKAEALKRTEKLQKQLKGPIEAARAESEARVLRAVQAVFNALKKQLVINKENKEQSAVPSRSEYLCTCVMRRKFEAECAAEAAMAAKLEAAMEDLAGKLTEG